MAREGRHAGRLVLAHTLPPSLIGPEHLASLINAGKTAKAMRHPNVAAVLSVAEQDGKLAVVSEYVDAETLYFLQQQALAQHAPLPVAVVLTVLHQLLVALCEVRSQWIAAAASGEIDPSASIHGGLNPGSVLIATFGEAMLADLAVGAAFARIDATREDPELLAYRAPEQLEGGHVPDERCDCYSFGVMAWELLSNRLMFEAERRSRAGGSAAEQLSRLRKAIRESSPLSQSPTRPGERLPGAVTSFVARALRRDPSRRFPSLNAMRDELAVMTRPLGVGSDLVASAVKRLAGENIEHRQRLQQEVTAAASAIDSTRGTRAPSEPAPERVTYALLPNFETLVEAPATNSAFPDSEAPTRPSMRTATPAGTAVPKARESSGKTTMSGLGDGVAPVPKARESSGKTTMSGLGDGVAPVPKARESGRTPASEGGEAAPAMPKARESAGKTTMTGLGHALLGAQAEAPTTDELDADWGVSALAKSAQDAKASSSNAAKSVQDAKASSSSAAKSAQDAKASSSSSAKDVERPGNATPTTPASPQAAPKPPRSTSPRAVAPPAPRPPVNSPPSPAPLALPTSPTTRPVPPIANMASTAPVPAVVRKLASTKPPAPAEFAPSAGTSESVMDTAGLEAVGANDDVVALDASALESAPPPAPSANGESDDAPPLERQAALSSEPGAPLEPWAAFGGELGSSSQDKEAWPGAESIAGSTVSADPLVAPDDQPFASPKRSKWTWPVAIAVALVALVTTGAALLRSPDEPSPVAKPGEPAARATSTTVATPPSSRASAAPSPLPSSAPAAASEESPPAEAPPAEAPKPAPAEERQPRPAGKPYRPRGI
ncbi:MAG: protein kinase [Polyangiaceae bacterium]